MGSACPPNSSDGSEEGAWPCAKLPSIILRRGSASMCWKRPVLQRDRESLQKNGGPTSLHLQVPAVGCGESCESGALLLKPQQKRERDVSV